jgi:hypothetical protein
MFAGHAPSIAGISRNASARHTTQKCQANKRSEIEPADKRRGTQMAVPKDDSRIRVHLQSLTPSFDQRPLSFNWFVRHPDAARVIGNEAEA